MRYNNRGNYISSSYRGPSSTETGAPQEGKQETSAPSSVGSVSSHNNTSTEDMYAGDAYYNRNKAYSGTNSRYGGVHKPVSASRYNNSNSNSGYYGAGKGDSYYRNQQYYGRYNPQFHNSNAENGAYAQEQTIEYSEDTVSRSSSYKSKIPEAASPVPPPTRSRFQNTTLATASAASATASSNTIHTPSPQQHVQQQHYYQPAQQQASVTNRTSAPGSPAHAGTWKRTGSRFNNHPVATGQPPVPLVKSTTQVNHAAATTGLAAVNSAAAKVDSRSQTSSPITTQASIPPPASTPVSLGGNAKEHFYAEVTKVMETSILAENDLKKVGTIKQQIREVFKDFEKLNSQSKQLEYSNMFKMLELQQSQVNYETVKLMSGLNQECLDTMLLQ